MPEPIQQKEPKRTIEEMRFEKKLDNLMRVMMEQFGTINDLFKKQGEKLDRFNEKLSETPDRDSKSVEEPVITKTEDSKKETELKEDNSILLPCLLYTSRCV